jgi:P2 family phage contractile tail tube protein
MADVKIPNMLKDANVYIEGRDYAGKAEIEIPSITQLTEDYTAMGISGKVTLPFHGHVDGMEGNLKFASIVGDAHKVLGDPSTAHHVDVRGSVQRYNVRSGKMDEYPVQIVMRSFFTEIKHPTYKGAQNEGPEFTFNALYVKIVIDGEEVLEVDPMSYVYRVNGIDVLAQTKTNLGM